MERPRRSFSLNKRPTKKKSRFIYYVRFRDENGNYLSAVSSGKTNRAAAEQWAYAMLESGILPQKRQMHFAQYAADFWDYELSRYIQGRLARGFSFSRRYADICRGNTENHLLPQFGHKKLTDITTEELDRWVLSLFHEGKLSPTTVNKLLTLMRVMLGEARREGYLHHNPALEVQPVKSQATEKSVLSGEEVQRLFAPDALKTIWQDQRRYLVLNLIAASTGMRQGEIRALQRQYIHDTYIDAVGRAL